MRHGRASCHAALGIAMSSMCSPPMSACAVVELPCKMNLGVSGYQQEGNGVDEQPVASAGRRFRECWQVAFEQGVGNLASQRRSRVGPHAVDREDE